MASAPQMWSDCSFEMTHSFSDTLPDAETSMNANRKVTTVETTPIAPTLWAPSIAIASLGTKETESRAPVSPVVN